MLEFQTGIANVSQEEQGRNWFLDRRHLCIGYFEQNMSKVHLVKSMKKELKEFAPLNTFMIDGLVYFTSQFSLDIIQYDIVSKKTCIYKFDNIKRQFQTVLYEKKIIFLPILLENNIYVFDTKEKKYAEKELKKENAQTWDCGIAYKDNNKVYMPIKEESFILELDLSDLICRKIVVPIEIASDAVYAYEGELWIASGVQKKIYHLNGEKYTTIDIYHQNTQYRKESFSRIERIGKQLFIFPRYEQYLYVVNMADESSKKILVSTEVIEDGPSLFFGCIKRENKIIFLPWRKAEVYEYNLDDDKLVATKLFVSAQSQLYYENGSIDENERRGLQWLIDLVTD